MKDAKAEEEEDGNEEEDTTLTGDTSLKAEDIINRRQQSLLVRIWKNDANKAERKIFEDLNRQE